MGLFNRKKGNDDNRLNNDNHIQDGDKQGKDGFDCILESGGIKATPSESNNAVQPEISNNYAASTVERLVKPVAAKNKADNTMVISPVNNMDVPHTDGSFGVGSVGAFDNGCLVGKAISIGRRQYQQDAILTTDDSVVSSFPNRWLAVLCDGMGGMNGGEKASALSVEMTKNAFDNYSGNNIPAFYSKVIDDIDYAVSDLYDENGNYLGAGTTFISTYIDNGNLYWASVGDSHIYFIRNGMINMVVREHNYFQDLLKMVEYGGISYEDAMRDPQKEALTSFIGMGGVSLTDISANPVKLIPGDIIMLCSDGMYRVLSDNEILSVIMQNQNDMNMAAAALLDAALSKNNPSQDNTSVILARYMAI